MKIRTPIRLIALMGALAVGATACGGSSSKAAPVTKATSTTQDPVKAKVLADFNGYADVVTRALADPSVTTQTVSQYLTGDALDGFTNSRIQLLTSGRVIKSDAVHHPRVVSVQGATALLSDCVTNNQSHYYAVQGGPHLSDSGDPTAQDEVTMQMDGGTWKVVKVVRKGTSCSA